jgi:XTP/dITP diphosphohydrolase
MPDAPRLVLATHNPGKAREIAALLAPHGVGAVGAGELGLSEPEETADTFAGNARLKALAAARAAGLPALADDSGLAVAALGGAPGVYSARWAPGGDFAGAMARVHAALGAGADRSAAFVCALCVAWPGGRAQVWEGRVDGRICWPPRGRRGFGYDPIFVPDAGDGRTFAEHPEAKDAISHRARAFAALLASGVLGRL